MISMVAKGRPDGFSGYLWSPSATPILVVGDIMLDTYISGTVDRISPEAPVPVLRQRTTRDTLGGAANVAANIAALGGCAHLVGCTGVDPYRARLESLLASFGVTADLVGDSSRATTVKTRFVSGHHQLMRLDCENGTPISTQKEEEILSIVERRLLPNGMLVLSDYGKGLLTDRLLASAVQIARSRNAPVLVDPKRQDFSVYRGASYIKPNRAELSLAARMPTVSDEEVQRAAEEIVRHTSAAVLVTRAEMGMTLATKDGEVEHLPTHSQEVYDVSGAGDTVMAAFSLAIHSGFADREAMRIANIAAGIVVRKPGTATVAGDELASEYLRIGEPEFMRGAVISRAEAMILRRLWKAQGLSVGFTNGCFDLLHAGHVKLLQEASQKSDRLVVGLNSDASVQRLKGPHRPIQSENDRAMILGALDAVSAVVIFSEDTPESLIGELMPDALFKGSDYRVDQIVGADLVLGSGGQVVTIDLVPGRSTTHLVQKSGMDRMSLRMAESSEDAE